MPKLEAKLTDPERLIIRTPERTQLRSCRRTFIAVSVCARSQGRQGKLFARCDHYGGKPAVDQASAIGSASAGGSPMAAESLVALKEGSSAPARAAQPL